LVLVDEALNVVSVHCFATPTNGACCPIEVRLASHHTPEAEAFAAQVQAYVAADAAIWKNLSEVAAAEYAHRRDLMLLMLGRSDHAALEAGGVL
jgi:hypothetical protein